MDEFNDPTAQKYITTKSMIYGTFSNTATNNSQLTAKILVDSVDISFILYEYGKYQVKSGSTYEYRISIKYIAPVILVIILISSIASVLGIIKM